MASVIPSLVCVECIETSRQNRQYQFHQLLLLNSVKVKNGIRGSMNFVEYEISSMDGEKFKICLTKEGNFQEEYFGSGEDCYWMDVSRV